MKRILVALMLLSLAFPLFAQNEKRPTKKVLKAQNEAMTNENKALKEENEGYKEQNTTLTKAVSALQEASSDLMQNNNSLQEQLTTTQKANEELQQVVKGLQETEENLNNTIANLKKEQETAQKRLKTASYFLSENQKKLAEIPEVASFLRKTSASNKDFSVKSIEAYELVIFYDDGDEDEYCAKRYNYFVEVEYILSTGGTKKTETIYLDPAKLSKFNKVSIRDEVEVWGISEVPKKKYPKDKDWTDANW